MNAREAEFLNTPLNGAGTQLNVLLASKGVRLDENATVRNAVHALKRAGLDARDTVQTLIMVGVFDPFLNWVDDVLVDAGEAHVEALVNDDLEARVDAIVQPLIPTQVPVAEIQTTCIDCGGEKGPAVFRFKDDEGDGLCNEDYITFMTDTERTPEECNELNDTLVSLS